MKIISLFRQRYLHRFYEYVLSGNPTWYPWPQPDLFGSCAWNMWHGKRNIHMQFIASSCIHETPLPWRHNEHDGVSNHQPYDWLLKRLFGGISKKIPKLHVTGLSEVNSPVAGEFPTERASDAGNFSIGWCHHERWTNCPFAKLTNG